MNKNFKTALFAIGVIAVITAMLFFVRKDPELSFESKVLPDSTKVNLEKTMDDTITAIVEELEVIHEEDSISMGETIKIKPIKPRSNNYFIQPLKGDLKLSGTFAELRHNHFHAGLDIRTGGVEGAEVFAAASGYVSRVKISERGYGKAIYIQHPNGSTTVYGHLQRFNGHIQEAVIAQQYRIESYEMDWYPKAGAIKVKQGDHIAFSGNTGGSGGPHLHFEIRDGKNGDTYNPLLYGIEAKDVIAPTINGIQIYRINEETREKCGTFDWRNLGTTQKVVHLKPGKYGIAAAWSEYFTDRMNRLGVNYAEMSIDGKVRFTQSLEHFAFDEGRFINQHMNFYHFAKTGVRYIKMFKDKGNRLNFYSGNGLLDLKDGDTHAITITIRDMGGHQTSHSFTIKANDKDDGAFQSAETYGGEQYMCRSNNTLLSENSKVVIPPYTMYNNFYLTLTEQDGSEKLASKMIRVHNYTVPLHQKITVSIKPKPEFAKYLNKCVLMEYDPGSRTSSSKGAKVEGKMVTEQVKNFGIFYLALDTIPPKVTLYPQGRVLTANVKDVTCDIGYYRGTIDGKWVLFEYEIKRGELKAFVPQSVADGKHKLKLVVRDEVGNETVIERDIQL